MNFEQIEDAIIAELKTALPYVPTIETYAGQLQGEIEELPIDYPAAFVMYSGSHYVRVDGQSCFNEVDIFTLLLVSKNLRGNEDMRKDADVGCYRMIKDVLENITNKNFGLTIERMQPISTKLIIATKVAIIYGIDFTTNFDKVY